MKRLIIIGNGFDLHHGMQTSYLNYREYLLWNGGKDMVECFEEQEELNEIYLWNDYSEPWIPPIRTMIPFVHCNDSNFYK